MSKPSRLGATVFILAASQAAFAGTPAAAANANAKANANATSSKGPTDAACARRSQDSAEALVQCIRRDPLWKHMVAFQQIANANPGPDGHPSRNIGEPGYLASAQYVLEKMAAAGYSVQLQEYTVPYFNYTSLATFGQVSPAASAYGLRVDWNPATYSGSGNVTAVVQPVGGIVIPLPPFTVSQSGCSSTHFSGFTPGNIALIQRGSCSNYTKVRNAQLAGASGVIIFNDGSDRFTGAFRGRVSAYNPVNVPVALASFGIGQDFYTRYNAAQNPVAHLDVQTIHDPYRPDYNVIAESPYGDPNRVVVVEGHLDAIYGAGMLDSASGSATILEVGLKMARTPTANRLRYVWFGGEELGLYGSQYYVDTLTGPELSRIVFDIDSDVTATPNYVTAIADPANSYYAGDFPPGVIEASQVGNNYFREYFTSRHLPYVNWSNDGTDSWSFSWRGVPNTGILTGQDCCKSQEEVDIFGGTVGNYEGNLGTFDGGFVDRPFLWGDNLDNNDPVVLEATSKALAYVVWKLANNTAIMANTGVAAKTSGPLGKSARTAPGKRDALGADR